MRAQTRALEEHGSGTVLSLGVISMLVAVFCLLQVPLADLVLKARTQSAVEQAALAGADALRGLTTGIPCEVASVVLLRNSSKMFSCRIVENTVYVSARINPFIVAEALAGTKTDF